MVPPAYVEYAPDPAVAAAAVCAWERVATASNDLLVLPDGCVDIVWRSDGALFVAGPDRGPARHRQHPGLRFLGVRIRPGAAATVLGNPADELCDQQVPLADLWGQHAVLLAERLAEAPTPGQQQSRLAQAIERRIADATLDLQVLAAARQLARSAAPVRQLSDDVALSERQLRRRFAIQVGYGPKTYGRVMRFRRFLALAATATRPIAEAAVEAGYSDQAHLTRESRRLSGTTPAEHMRRPADDGRNVQDSA